MSKAKDEGTGMSKSKAIREYYAANPKAKPRQIAEALVAQGHSVTAQYVSVILSGDRRKAGKVTRRGRKPAAAKTEAAVAPAKAPRAAKSGSEPTLSALESAKKLIDATGGVANAKAALDALAKLLGTN